MGHPNRSCIFKFRPDQSFVCSSLGFPWCKSHNARNNIKMHQLQAKIIPDCLFKCIFFIILHFFLHFKIISMPIYSELNWTASKSNWSQRIFSQYSNKFSAPGWSKNLFFLCQNLKICMNGAMTSLAWTLLPAKLWTEQTLIKLLLNSDQIAPRWLLTCWEKRHLELSHMDLTLF